MKVDQQKRTLDEWLGNHRGLIFRIVRAYAFNEHDREDLFQEIAFQLWESIPRFRAESAVTTWIHRVALFSSIAWSRREVRHADRTQEMIEPPVFEETEEDPRVSWLYEQIARLDVVNRTVVLLMLEGLDYREIANTLGISEENVAVKVHRVKKLLAERSSRKGTDDGV